MEMKWMIFTVLFGGFVPNVYGDWNSCGDDYSMQDDLFTKCDITCERYPVVLRCPGDDVIQILSAEYGRTSATKCRTSSSETKDTNCALAKAKDIVSERCNNRTECSFTVSNEVFPDPCPGTKKYLETKFLCVKYIFGCPGELVGIGDEKMASIAVQPNPGSWTKDPLLSNEHVFFAPSVDVVHEYSSWEDFIEGSYRKRYNLPHSATSGNIVVYDKNLYYVKADSRNIIRYSLITESRTKEGVIPVSKMEENLSGGISLAVDEYGLWVIFPGDEGRLNIGKLDKDHLTVTRTWSTILTRDDSLYNFFICGTLYSVNPKSGRIDYSFNTNKPPGEEGKTTIIPFDKEKVSEFGRHSRKYRKRSFLKFNASSVSYNPRERLLYLWDERSADAVYFKLHFDTKSDSEDKSINVEKPGTTTSSKTSKFTSSPDSFPSKEPINQPSRLPRTSCTSAIRHHIIWPTTSPGDIAQVECPDRAGGSATWRCRPSPTDGPRWDPEGPDFSKCIVWLSDIISLYKADEIDRRFAFESLKSALSIRTHHISGKWIEVISNFLAELMEDTTVPTKSDGKGIVESAAKIISMLFRAEDAWNRIGDKVTEIAGSLLRSFKRAAFLYSDAVSISPGEYNDKEVLRVRSSTILAQIEVRDNSLRYPMTKSKTIFPDAEFCDMSIDQCRANVVLVPDDVIRKQMGPASPSTVMFAYYKGMENFLSTQGEGGWEIDSNVVSVALRYKMLRTTEVNPLTVILKHKTVSSLPRQCMHWTQSERGQSGNWSSGYCRVQSSNDTHTECLCDRPSTFAVFADKAVTVNTSRDKVVEIIVGIGSAVAAVCFAVCVVTFVVFKNLQNDRNTILKNLCFSLMMLESIFFFGINRTENFIFCSIIAGILHYFLLTTFMWMALSGIQIYIMLIELFEEQSRRRWYYLAGYGIPAVILGVTIATGYTNYTADKGCIIDPFSDIIWSPIATVIVFSVVNICPLLGAMYKIHKSTLAFADSVKITASRTYIKAAFALLGLQLLTWALAMFWISERTTVLGCLFCIFNGLQALLVLLVYCFTPEVRQEYIRALERFPCRETSKESYVENSMTFSKHYTPGRFANTGSSTATRHLTIASQSRHPWETSVTLPKTVDSSPMLGYSLNGPGNREVQEMEQWHSGDQPTSFTIRPIYNHERYHEQQPFPTSYEASQRQNVQVPDPQNDIAYSRLQHHRHHSAYYPHGPQYEMEHILPPARYRTGITQSTKQNNRTNTVAQTCGIRTNPHFGPSSRSQAAITDIIFHQDHHHHRQRSTPEDGPVYWELDPPYLRSHGQNDQRIQDVGMVRNILPQNSIIQRLRNEMPSFADSDEEYQSVGKHSPILAPSVELWESPSKTNSKKILTNQKRKSRNSSEDEGQGSSFEDQENSNLCSQSDIAATRCARHDDKSIISPSETQNMLATNDRRFRSSLNSDSDDPIATDCSGSSYGSSYGQKNNGWSNQEMLV